MEQIKPRQLSRAYSILLFVYGCASLLLALGLKSAVPHVEREMQTTLLMSVSIHVLFGIAAIWIALLRLLKGAASLPASNALGIGLAVEFPLGTALFLYWLIRVRPMESPLQLGSKSSRWFTAGLFIAALGFSMSASVFRFISSPGDLSGILEILASAYIGVSILLAAVGTVRCLSPRWGYYATFGLSVILALSIPIGTLVSLLWFLKVRKDDQELASTPHVSETVKVFD